MAQAGYTTENTRWLVAQAIAPMNPHHEGPRLNTSVGDDGLHVVFPYRERLRHCVSRYIAMNESDRIILQGGVEDGVKWRGEPMSFYLTVADETLKMREMGVEAYREANRAALEAAGIRPRAAPSQAAHRNHHPEAVDANFASG